MCHVQNEVEEDEKMVYCFCLQQQQQQQQQKRCLREELIIKAVSFFFYSFVVSLSVFKCRTICRFARLFLFQFHFLDALFCVMLAASRGCANQAGTGCNAFT
jgi:hypothetical protein